MIYEDKKYFSIYNDKFNTDVNEAHAFNTADDSIQLVDEQRCTFS